MLIGININMKKARSQNMFWPSEKREVMWLYFGFVTAMSESSAKRFCVWKLLCNRLQPVKYQKHETHAKKTLHTWKIRHNKLCDHSYLRVVRHIQQEISQCLQYSTLLLGQIMRTYFLSEGCEKMKMRGILHIYKYVSRWSSFENF